MDGFLLLMVFFSKNFSDGGVRFAIHRAKDGFMKVSFVYFTLFVPLDDELFFVGTIAATLALLNRAI